jgi:hypothetical protein
LCLDQSEVASDTVFHNVLTSVEFAGLL